MWTGYSDRIGLGIMTETMEFIGYGSHFGLNIGKSDILSFEHVSVCTSVVSVTKTFSVYHGLKLIKVGCWCSV